jgi:hypothetical protein
MSIDQKMLATLLAKEEIRELAMLYSRGVDRKDIELLRTLYAKGSTDDHGKHYNGDAEGYLQFLEKSFPHMTYSGHHICNHLVSVEGDRGEGEVYAIAYHVFADRQGGWIEDFMTVRYIDRYVRQMGRWLFASRVVAFDHRTQRSVPAPEGNSSLPVDDPSYTTLASRLFARGPRA